MGLTDKVVHCGFQNGLWTELSFPEFPSHDTLAHIQHWATIGHSDRPLLAVMVILVVVIKLIINQNYKQFSTFFWDWFGELARFSLLQGALNWSNVKWILLLFIIINNLPWSSWIQPQSLMAALRFKATRCRFITYDHISSSSSLFFYHRQTK